MMNPSSAKTNYSRFKRWSRKSFAVYNSLSRHITIGVLSAACLMLIAPVGRASRPDTLLVKQQGREVDLDEVVVSAQRAPVVASGLMRVVHVLTQKEIERSARGDLPGLLQNIRGVDVRSRGAFGIQSDIGIRGGTFDQTLLLINGVPVNDPQTGHHLMNLPLDVQAIDRIEVLQGSGARMFGPNAFNGAVHLITRNPGTQAVRLRLGGGSHAYLGGALSGGFQKGNSSHLISGGYQRSNGHTANTDFTSASIFYGGHYRAGENRIEAMAGYHGKAFGANQFYTPRFPDQFEEIQSHFLSFKFIPGNYPDLQATAYYRGHKDRFELFRHEAPAWYAGHNHHLNRTAGFSVNARLNGKKSTSLAGLETRYEHIYSNVLGFAMNQPKEVTAYPGAQYTRSYDRFGLSLMAEHNLYLGNFGLSAGALLYIGNRLQGNAGFFPGIDLGWQLSRYLRWHASVGRALRLPTFTDLFYSGPVNRGNPELSPEHAIHYETGLTSERNGWRIDFVLFARDGKNMIDWVRYPEEEIWQSMNHGRVLISGVESGLVYSSASGNDMALTEFSLHYSYVHVTTDALGMVSNYALDHLRHKVDAGMQMQLSTKLQLSVQLSYAQRAGGYYVYGNGQYFGPEPFKPLLMADASVRYQMNRMGIVFNGTNLFNSPSVSIANVPQPGRWMGVSLEFQLF